MLSHNPEYRTEKLQFCYIHPKISHKNNRKCKSHLEECITSAMSQDKEAPKLLLTAVQFHAASPTHTKGHLYTFSPESCEFFDLQREDVLLWQKHNAIKTAARSTDKRARLATLVCLHRANEQASPLTRAATSEESLCNYFSEVYFDLTASYLDTVTLEYFRNVLFFTVKPCKWNIKRVFVSR